MRLSSSELSAVADRARRVNLAGALSLLVEGGEPRLADSRTAAERLRTLREELPNEAAARVRLERIIKGNELTDVAYLARGVVAARSVGRVVIREHGRVVGYGTGFLAAPGVLVTNEHVLASVDEVAESTVQFRYELGVDGSELQPVEFRFDASVQPIIHRELDVAIVAVGDRVAGDQLGVESFGWLRLDPTPGKGIVGEYLTIIQHPGGERKQVCVRENKLLLYDENGPYLWYQTDTVGGSSGSPVFNNSWEVVGLHHSGVPASAVAPGDPLAADGDEWVANEGIRISSIAAFLETQASPLAGAVLGAPRSPWPEVSDGSAPATTQLAASSAVLPGAVAITIHVGSDTEPAAVAPPAATRPDPSPSTGEGPDSPPVPPHRRVVERVEVDADYDRRNGFDPEFLGVEVPLPRTNAAGDRADVVLGYWNYSVVMHPTRRLARCSAANVDPSRWRGRRDADGDRWFVDDRCRDVAGEEFYGTQRSAFEADRSRNPFDRGHLCARRDLQWGVNDAEAKRNGDDSYHFTNCAPQHFQFNQRSRANGLWFRLESQAAEQTSGAPMCVLNGPVFDAPAGRLRPDGLVELDPDGDARPDPSFNGVQIPTQFFKIVAWAVGDELRCVGFVVSQEALLATVPAMRWTARRFERLESNGQLSAVETALYRLPVGRIGEMTGLDVGPLVDADHDPPSEATTTPLLRSHRDLRAVFSAR